MTFYVAGRLTPTNVAIVDAFRALDVPVALLPLEQVVRRARPGDAVLPRIDVAPTLDGIESDVDVLGELEARDVFVVNPAAAILASHDKLITALRLGLAGVPHPLTMHVDGPPERLAIEPPFVVKPRYGSWGRDIVLCRSRRELDRSLRALAGRSWFSRQGALVQELVPPCGHDLRVLVAGGSVVGAVRRVAANGEWRTNIALGGHRVPAAPCRPARELALEAAEAVGAGFVGVDLLPRDDGFVVVEINGCVDFTPEYSIGADVHLAVADALARAWHERAYDLTLPRRRGEALPLPGRDLVH